MSHELYFTQVNDIGAALSTVISGGGQNKTGRSERLV